MQGESGKSSLAAETLTGSPPQGSPLGVSCQTGSLVPQAVGGALTSLSTSPDTVFARPRSSSVPGAVVAVKEENKQQAPRAEVGQQNDGVHLSLFDMLIEEPPTEEERAEAARDGAIDDANRAAARKQIRAEIAERQRRETQDNESTISSSPCPCSCAVL